MFGPNQSARPVGVRIPEGQSLESTNLPPLTLVHLVPLEMFGGQYSDETGRLRGGMFVKSGDDFYLVPNGEQWIGQLRPLSNKLLAQAREAYRRLVSPKDAGVPTEDTVDVIASEITKESSDGSQASP